MAEEKILNAKQEWERTFDAITDPVMILDIEYRIIKTNKALAAKLELTPREVQGLYCYRVIHETHCPPENCPYTRLMAEGQSHTMEFLAPHLGGHFCASVSPIVGADGVLQSSICIARNIDEQKTLEAQLIHAQKMEAIGQLAGGIAHDFNNILTAIIGFSSILEMEMTENDPGRENVHHVLAAADRAAELTRSLLTFSRKQVINPLPIKLNDLVVNVYKFLQRILGEDIELTTSLKHDSMTINADSGQIEQVLMNLATNARDAMPEGGTISIRTELVELEADFVNSQGYGSAGQYALVSVTDSGCGMSESTRKRLFEPFFTTKEVGKGTGLGLSIVYGIIKQHNGFITVSSTPGSGTTFMIYLPVVARAAEARGSKQGESVGAGSETILVADDDPLLRSLLEKTLTMFGYTVISAIDGQDAVQKFTGYRDSIALILMDIIMPNMNGREAFEQIRMISPGVRAIFISGYSADIIHKRGMLDQELEVLAKPLSPMVLLKKVREVLDR
jgi:PAS domain S-box-containing protein